MSEPPPVYTDATAAIAAGQERGARRRAQLEACEKAAMLDYLLAAVGEFWELSHETAVDIHIVIHLAREGAAARRAGIDTPPLTLEVPKS